MRGGWATQCPEEYRQKTAASQEALLRETDFAFKQSFAFCPYSPEAVFRYINFLLQFGRLEDALLIAQTCQKLDPYNDQVNGLVKQLGTYNNTMPQTRAKLKPRCSTWKTRRAPTRAMSPIYWPWPASTCQMQQTNRAIELFDRAMNSSNIDCQRRRLRRPDIRCKWATYPIETVIERLVTLAPDQPEPCYDLAALDAVLGKQEPALQNLRKSLELSARRLKTNSAARDLMVEVRKDHRFDPSGTCLRFNKLSPLLSRRAASLLLVSG